MLSVSLNINSKCKQISNMMFKSQHLVVNPGQGPASKCPPGHKSMVQEDVNIIKGYWHRSGVMGFRLWFPAFSPFLGRTSHPGKYVLGMSPSMRLKMQVWLDPRHWHITRDLASPSEGNFLGTTGWVGFPQTPHPGEHFLDVFPWWWTRVETFLMDILVHPSRWLRKY